MFKRLYAMFLAVILLVTVMLSSLAWMVLRDRQVNMRLDELKREARSVAWLGANRSRSSEWRTFLRMQAESIHEEFGAYIIVVDRFGNMMDNLRTTYAEDPDFAASLDGAEITEALKRVVNGEEISVRTVGANGATFTVGVPYVQDEIVLGAVFIQTNVQTVEDGLQDLLRQVVLVSSLALGLAAVWGWFFTRSILNPLKKMTQAAGRMAEGDFTVHAPTDSGGREMRELGTAFNSMAERLDHTEQNRREFVANVSHELRSPITSISGFVEGMRDGTIPAEEHPKYLGIVADETKRLTKLIGDLLALSRLEREDAALTITEFDICEMIRQVVIRRMNDIEEKKLDLECDFDEESMAVSADRDRIEQVVINVLDNALKFTPEGGRIDLRVRRSGGICAVTVADNGPGVLPDDRGRVFDRFFTEDRAHTAGKGTGLGLSICQRIMQMHGQSIHLDETDVGASFTFTLKKA